MCYAIGEAVRQRSLSQALGGQFTEQFGRNLGGAGSDELLTTNEIATITSIDVSKQEIADLKGIRYFTALQELDCSVNRLASLDVSGLTTLTELYCQNSLFPIIGSLNVSGCTALTRLNCSANRLASLDVSDITALKWLDCSTNRLAFLEVSGLSSLKILNCSFNQIASLDVSGLTTLTELYCTGQVWATPPGVPGYFEGSPLVLLNVSGCVSLTILECWGGHLTSLDVSGLEALQTLKCSFNWLRSLDLTGLDNLENFEGSMQMSSLTLSRDGNRYSAAVAINANTSFDNQALSYTNGILTSTNSAVAYSDFNAPTGLANKTLSGVFILSYAGQPVPVLLDAPKDWNGSGTATAKIDAPLADFIRLTLNGAEVDKANYSLTEGSTVITFKESYLKTFAVGTHTFTAVFAGGTVDIPLKVSAAGNSDKLPATGDSTAPLALCALLAGLGGILLTARRRRLQP